MDKPDRQIRPYALKEGEGGVYRFGIDFTLKASEVQSGNVAAFLESRTEQGEEPPEHTHRTEDEMFYMSEGSVTFRGGEDTFDVEKVGFIFLPAGIKHGYTIRSEEPVRLIAVTAPGRDPGSTGWGGFVSDMELGQGEHIAKPGHAEF